MRFYLMVQEKSCVFTVQCNFFYTSSLCNTNTYIYVSMQTKFDKEKSISMYLKQNKSLLEIRI